MLTVRRFVKATCTDAKIGAMNEMRAREVLTAAGLSGGAELLALGENAVFAVDDLVVKVGRDAVQNPELRDRAEREVAVAQWLAASGVPAVRVAEPGARLVEGHPVTLWHRLPDAVRPAEPQDLARLLTLVHALPAPDGFALPRRELLGGVERWLRLAGDAIDPADADYLRERRDGFAAAAAALIPHLPPGPIHGDALPRNVHVGPNGPVLVDLETFSADLREHDLVVPAAVPGPVRAGGRGVRRLHRRVRLGRPRMGRLRGAARGAGDGQLRVGVPARADQSESARGVPPPGGVAARRRPGGAVVSVLGLD